MKNDESDVPQLQLGSITLDASRHVVSLRGRRVQLGQRETDVMRVLIEAGGRPVDARAIFQRSWGCEPGAKVARVRGVIGRLRVKLRAAELIETIGREGYRIVAGR